jgi:hypothetical protein
MVLAIVVGLIVLVGLGVKLYDLKRRRDADAVALQAQISDALLRDPGLFGLPVTPTVRIPTWAGSPAIIEIAGQVPAEESHRAVLDVVRGEAARIRSDIQIEDRVTVVPSMAVHAA